MRPRAGRRHGVQLNAIIFRSIDTCSVMTTKLNETSQESSRETWLHSYPRSRQEKPIKREMPFNLFVRRYVPFDIIDLVSRNLESLIEKGRSIVDYLFK